MEECPKNPFGMSAYDKWTLKQQILPIFHFDQISDVQMDRVLNSAVICFLPAGIHMKFNEFTGKFQLFMFF